MVKGIVKTNKANDTKFIYLGKDCGLLDGQEVDIKPKGLGIYSKNSLEQYYNDNKEMFTSIREKKLQLNKQIWFDELDEFAEIIDSVTGYGKLQCEEGTYFFENDSENAWTTIDGDIECGVFDNFVYNTNSVKMILNEEKKTKEELKKELLNFALLNLVQKKLNYLLEKHDRLEEELFESYGFEKVESRTMELVVYSNGIVQIYYDSESFSYDGEMKVTTLHDISSAGDNLEIEF